jgi:cysteine desulfuration protein SufE
VLEKLEAVVAELGESDRRERIELLIDLANGLPPLPPELSDHKDEAHRVPECQSPVYLFVAREGDRLRLHADVPPEAPTVRGFMAALVEGLDGSPIGEAVAFPADLLKRSGIEEILGMQRVSGLNGVLRRLRGMIVAAAEGQ